MFNSIRLSEDKIIWFVGFNESCSAIGIKISKIQGIYLYDQESSSFTNIVKIHIDSKKTTFEIFK